LAEGRWTIHTPVFEADQICPAMRSYPWCGHRNFAYDLTRFVRPRRIVELGTHWGTSFFAFCQAVKDAGLDTHCVAVDTWKGDKHTGPYDEQPYRTVRRIVQSCFGDLRVDLLRMLFRDALGEVDDESVDILHIDGCHDYDAVSDDYRTWLPKLGRNGIVLLHDVAPDCGYESARFWAELCGEHPGFALPHSWGLGVLFPKGDRWLKAMRAEGLCDKLRVYEYKELALSRAQAIEQQSQMIEQRDAHVRGLERDLNSARALAEERYEALQQQSQMIRQRDEHVAGLQRDLAAAQDAARQRYEAIQEQSRLIAERDADVAEARALAEQRYEAIQEQSRMIADRDARLADARTSAEQRYEAIQEQSRMIAERDAHVRELQQRIGTLEQEKETMSRELSERIERLSERLDGLQRTLDHHRPNLERLARLSRFGRKVLRVVTFGIAPRASGSQPTLPAEYKPQR
jgi:hypothetical protein